MDVIITEWALASYLNLVAAQAFTDDEYWKAIRPDVECLKTEFPNGTKLQNAKFWGPSRVGTNNVPDGYKMKWHNMGSGRVQLRVSVAIPSSESILCRGFVKDNDSTDQREAAKLKAHIEFIKKGQYIRRGKL